MWNRSSDAEISRNIHIQNSLADVLGLMIESQLPGFGILDEQKSKSKQKKKPKKKKEREKTKKEKGKKKKRKKNCKYD